MTLRSATWLTVLVSACLCAQASAGSYQVAACAAAPGAVNHSWIAFDSEPGFMQTTSHCGVADVTGHVSGDVTSGLAVADVLNAPHDVPAGVAGWTATAPADTVITAVQMDRDLFSFRPFWVEQLVDGGGNVVAGEQCIAQGSNGFNCELAGSTSHSGLFTSALTLELVCFPPASGPLTQCADGTLEHQARVELNSATVTIANAQNPAISNASGPLLSGGWLAGTHGAQISGSDNTGIQFARAYVDGTPVAQTTPGCDFTYMTPCPQATGQPLSVDTSKLSDGPHQVQLSLVDPSGNETRGASQTVLTDNTAPGPPTGLIAAQRYTRSADTLTWQNPAQGAGAPISAVHWQACTSAGSCSAVQTQRAPLTQLSLDPRALAPFGQAPSGNYSVAVWLEDAAGNTDPGRAARAIVTFAAVPPPPVSGLTMSPASSDQPDTRATWTAGGASSLAPIAGFSWSLCQGSRCQSGASGPPVSLTVPGAGRWTFTVLETDTLGNSSPPQTATFDYRPAVPGTPGTPSPGAPAGAIRGLHLRVHGRRLTIAGRVTGSRIPKRIDVRVTLVTATGTSQGLKRSAKVVRRRFLLHVSLPPAERLRSVTIQGSGLAPRRCRAARRGLRC